MSWNMELRGSAIPFDILEKSVGFRNVVGRGARVHILMSLPYYSDHTNESRWKWSRARDHSLVARQVLRTEDGQD
jgi:hypothetical protein